jgi:L-asparaginase / beta-aspartyl-peptidase
MSRYAIVVHGGCGRWESLYTARALKGVRAAAQVARLILEEGGSALDAVCAAVAVLEDNPLFNAGTGCVLNRDGEAEMDASVMVSEGLRCGGVAAIRRVKNPVLVARRVMEATPHVLLAAAGALDFARREGFPDYDPITGERLARHRRTLQALEALRAAAGETVGAVACDTSGRLAAATSTGGITMKMPGRIGDSPIPGAGNYAMPGAAASATGTGELMMRTLATKSVCDLVAAGRAPRSAARKVVSDMELAGDQSAGIIALDGSSRVGIAMRGGVMPHAWLVQGEHRISARITAD